MRLQSWLRRTAFLGACLLLALSAPAFADEDAPQPAKDEASEDASTPKTFPLSEIRPGMRGYGLTVKSGTTIERFEVEVIDVLHNYLAKQDLILVRCLGDAFADHQIARGMSGSPVYFDGRIAGALAYTWPWAKHAVGGITPIASMLAEGERPLEGRPNGYEPPTILKRGPRPVDAGVTKPAPGELQPIGTPLCTAGFSEATRRELVEACRATGIHAVDGGTIGAPLLRGGALLDAKLEPGAAMVIEMVRGDFTVATIGTATWVDGDKVYGFGHPYQSLGETAMPMSVGYIYMIVASREISFKVGAPLSTVGTVIQDRPSGIVGTLGDAPEMVAFDVNFTNVKTGRKESFAFEISPNTHVFSRMMVLTLREAFGKAETTLGRNTKRFTMRLEADGIEPLVWKDAMAGFDGGFQRNLLHLTDRVLNHQRQRTRLRRFTLDVEIEHVDRRAQLITVTPSKDEVRRGETLELVVDLEKREGAERARERIEVTIPDDAPLGNYAMRVVGGDFVSDTIAAPVDLADLPAQYASFYSSSDLMTLLPTSRVDVTVDGRVLRQIPVSMVPRIARSPSGVGLKFHPVTEKVRREVPYVVMGSATVQVRVVD